MRRKKQIYNPELITEEVKRFKLLTEYSFYQEENILAPSGNPEKPIILGNDLEEGEDVEDQEPQDFDQMGVEDETPAGMGDDLPPDIEGDEEIDFEQEPENNEELPMDEPPLEEPIPEDDGVEIDVTDLVKGSEEAKEAAFKAMEVSKNTGQELMSKFSDLEARLAKMDSVANKIENLEKEIVKRNPTPVEKLEMRSLSSYPYNIKLSDYWAEKDGQYDVMDKENKEYVLTKDDVDSNFSYSQVKNTFDKPTDEQGYEEEEI
ncbi:MAG: hypothetical protein QG594_425 [Bacteroidota bacterium]|nr:hypothetical protein [Bacteroidota bacterium]